MTIEVKTDISAVAMLCSLSIGRIGGTKVDKTESHNLTAQHNMSQDSAIVSKRLFTNSDLRPINTICNEAKVIRNKYTLPWNDMGMRLLPNSVYTEFDSHMLRLNDEFKVAVEQLEQDYPRILNDAKNRLNGMFSADDYPKHISDKFRFKLDIMPMPTGEGLRINCISDDQRQALQDKRDKETLEIVKKSATEVVHRMFESLNILLRGTDGNGGLLNPDARFHQTAIDRVTEILDMAPSLNILGNPDLENLVNDVKEALSPENIDIKEIRQSKEIRQEVAQNSLSAVMKIQEAMEGFC
jgi:hypothetical protein